MNDSQHQPRIALTLGDVAGIGPEIVARCCLDERLREVARPLVVGDPQVLGRALELIGHAQEFRILDALEEVESDGPLCCWNPCGWDLSSVAPGRVQPLAGKAAYECLVAATASALTGHCDAIVTAPLSKAALHLAGHDYPGHTEILAQECGVREVAMMLYLPPNPSPRSQRGLGVAHVTLHTSLRSVPELLTVERITETARLLNSFMQRVGCESPRIAVCALNPHGGEAGLFGVEEDLLIEPAVESLRRELEITGPLPADTLLKRAVDGEFDGVVAMYHDQGHIALKLLAFHRAVNVTLGLPIVRTSPSHGTAFDIAWQGRADHQGLFAAVEVAARLAGHPSPL